MRRLCRVIVWVFGILSFVGVARAHQLSQDRLVSPLPLSLLFVGAGATVAVTAGWLAVGDHDSRNRDTAHGRVFLSLSPGVGRGLRVSGRVGFSLVVAAVLAHGIVGRTVPAENLATLFVWGVWLKGIGLLAILFGSPWRTISPWEGLYDLLVRLEGREMAVLGRYPDWLGSWPAVVGFVVTIGVVENLTVITRSPRLTVLFVVGYALVMVFGAVAFGRTWFRRADTLAVLYRLFGRVAPVRFERTAAGGYDVTVRGPWRDSSERVSDGSVVVFVVATVYTVSFDGFTNTQLFQSVVFELRTLLGLGASVGLVLYFAGLVGFVLSYYLAILAVQQGATGSSAGWRGTAAAFAGSVVPIAAAYELAHNYPFVARNLGGVLTVGRDLLFDGGGAITLLEWLSVSVFWWSQVVLIVGGHVVAVVAAHRVATARYGSQKRARRGHLPLVLVMVGYTVLSLWIVSRPVTA